MASRPSAADMSDAPVHSRLLPKALPQFGPVSLRIFTFLWLLALPLAIAAPAVDSYYRVQAAVAPVWRPLGISVDFSSGIRIRAVHSEEARSAGLARNDRIVAIDGRQVPPTGLQAVRAWVDGPEGSRFDLTVQTGAAPPRVVTLTRRANHADESFAGTGFNAPSYAVVVVVAQLVPGFVLIVAALLLFRRRRDRVAALLSLSLLLIAATLFAPGFWDIFAPSLVGWVGSAGWLGLALVLLVFPTGRFEPRWTVLPMLLAVPWMALSIARLVTRDMDNIGTVLILAAGVVALAIRYRRLQPGAEKQQLRWVFLGFAWGTACIGLVVLLIAMQEVLLNWDSRFLVWAPIIFYLIGGLGVIAYAGGLLVSMLRYRLYDADAVISRSAGYAALTIGFVAVFAASEKMIEIVVERYFAGTAGAVSGALAATVAALLIPPMHRRFHGWAERRFRKPLLHLRRDLPRCVADLRETAPMETMVEEVLSRVQSGTRAAHVAIEIGEHQVAARGGGGDFPVRIPLSIDHQEAEVGTLLIGPRPDGTVVGKDERQALLDVADPIARAIRVVQQREARDETTRRALARLSKRLKSVEAALGRPAG